MFFEFIKEIINVELNNMSFRLRCEPCGKHTLVPLLRYSNSGILVKYFLTEITIYMDTLVMGRVPFREYQTFRGLVSLLPHPLHLSGIYSRQFVQSCSLPQCCWPPRYGGYRQHYIPCPT